MQSWSRVRNFGNRAVFEWLSKVITWLRLLRLVIGLKGSRQFFNQWEAKPKPIAPWTRDFSRAWSESQMIARNCDWFMALFVRVVIGRSNCFGFGFSTVIWKPLYHHCKKDDKVTKITKMTGNWLNFRVTGSWSDMPRFNVIVQASEVLTHTQSGSHFGWR